MNHNNDFLNKVYKDQNFNSILPEFSTLDDTLDKMDKKNKDKIFATSYHYFYEIVDSYEQIMFLMGNINLYRKYTSNYIQNESNSPNGLYYQLNLTFYDRRYLNFCSMAIERIYAYWERIAFLLFQFIKPKTEQIGDKKLSFFNLIKSLVKDIECQHHLYLDSPNSSFKWFNDFHKNGHHKLTHYRHPLVHFQKKRNEFKGGLWAGTHTIFLQNTQNKKNLIKLQKKNESLCSFLNDQFGYCEMGYKKVADLIKETQDNSVL